MVQAGKHTELKSDLERLKRDAESLYTNLADEKDKILIESAVLEELGL